MNRNEWLAKNPEVAAQRDAVLSRRRQERQRYEQAWRSRLRRRVLLLGAATVAVIIIAAVVIGHG
jgi:hypothetical protein